MRTYKTLTLFLTAIAGGLLAVFTYAQLVQKPQIVYNYGYGQPRLVSGISGGQQAVDLTFAAEQTVHAVVHVRTKSVSENKYPTTILDFLYGGGDTRQEPVMGFGSGVIITPDGYIVTNHHVIKGAQEVSVKLNDNREFDAKVIGDDPSTDIALIKIEANQLPFVPFGNSETLKLGEWVLAVGNPFNLTSTVTAGIVSAKARNLNIIDDNYRLESFIQTDAALNPGNSGGALVNIKGELVGVNTAIISPTGGYAGNSFAVPVTIVKKVVDDLREYGAVQRAFLGITPADVNAEIAKQNNLNVTTGVFVAEIKETGAAKDAGINKADVVLKINDVAVANTSEMLEQLSKYRPKDKIQVTILRNNKEMEFDVVLRNLQGETTLVKPADATSVMGATLSELGDPEKQKLGIRYGVKITGLSPGKFSKAGIEEGFVITRMNNKAVTNIKELKLILENTRGGVYVEGIYPNGVIAYYAFGL